jgi:hypothetical protein
MSVVRNWLTPIREKVEYISPDGLVYRFHDPTTRAVLSMSGWGVLPVEKATTRGPFQHGRTPLTERVPARQIRVNMAYQRCSREDYLAARTEMINILRYNRSSMDDPQPGHLRWYRADGTIRQADVILAEGPSFDSQRSFAIEETLVFDADNPIIYDPEQVTDTISALDCEFQTQLTFPFAFTDRSLNFGLSFCEGFNTATVPYVGTFEEYPIVEVNGPALNIAITHADTGLILGLEYDIPAGETVFFDLSYDKKLVYNSNGDDLLGYVTDVSSIGLWSLLPDPLVPDGVNHLSIALEDGTPDTSVIFRYYNRYIGV